MSFQNIYDLTSDVNFNSRVQACCAQNAGTIAADAPAEQLSLARNCQMGGPAYTTFVHIIAAFPGLAEKALDNSGKIDQTLIGDPDILAQVQANWSHVATLQYNADGTAKPLS